MTHRDNSTDPIHISKVIDNVVDEILENVVMNDGQPPTLQQAKELKRRWLDEPPVKTDS